MKKRAAAAFVTGIAITLAAILCPAALSFADKEYTISGAECFDFFAMKITFESDRVVVEGYFYNFTLDRIIHGIDNLEMAIYDADDKTICYGAFTNLSDSLKALRLMPGYTCLQKFEFNNTKRNPEDYNLDTFSAGIMCGFTQSGVN